MNDSPLIIAIMQGTTRPGCQSIKAARFVEAIGREQPGVETVFVNPRDFTFLEDGDEEKYRDPKYTEIVTRADAYFIVMPEYNHSFPSSLKRMLDSEYGPYHRKPVALAGVSNGDWGGARGTVNLLPVLRSLHMLPINQAVYFKRVDDLFNENDTMDATQEPAYRKSVAGTFRELIWMARALKTARKMGDADIMG